MGHNLTMTPSSAQGDEVLRSPVTGGPGKFKTFADVAFSFINLWRYIIVLRIVHYL